MAGNPELLAALGPGAPRRHAHRRLFQRLRQQRLQLAQALPGLCLSVAPALRQAGGCQVDPAGQVVEDHQAVVETEVAVRGVQVVFGLVRQLLQLPSQVIGQVAEGAGGHRHRRVHRNLVAPVQVLQGVKGVGPELGPGPLLPDRYRVAF